MRDVCGVRIAALSRGAHCFARRSAPEELPRLRSFDHANLQTVTNAIIRDVLSVGV